jgi:hypothetical protein
MQARSTKGNSMAEFGPALCVILICFFFPMLNMLSLGIAYGDCMVLNKNQVQEAALIDWKDARDPQGPICKGIVDQWQNGMGNLVKMPSAPVTTVSYRDGETAPDNTVDKIVNVQTTVTCSPFLTIPLPVVNVPGINGPMVFTINSEKLMENPDYAGPQIAASFAGPGGGGGGTARSAPSQGAPPVPNNPPSSASPAGPAGPGGPLGPAGPGWSQWSRRS